MKVKTDIVYLKRCKQEELNPSFCQVNLAIQRGSQKLKSKIAKLVLETELQNKHELKRKIKDEICQLENTISRHINFITFEAVKHKIYVMIKSRQKAVQKRHDKKLCHLRSQKREKEPDSTKIYLKNTVRNLSSYSLTDIEEKALSYGLDQQVPIKPNQKALETEFELFYQNLLRKLNHLPTEHLSKIKTKLRVTCEKYGTIRIPNKYRQAIKQLQENQAIVILQQDKGRGVVILDREKYTQKCLTMLNDNQFQIVQQDQTSTIERKIQDMVRKIKGKLSKKEYRTVYPTGSSPAKMYGTAKVHKLKTNNVDDLPLRPIISNVGTASYHLAKYLAKLLSPLSFSEYTVSSSKQFISEFTKKRVPRHRKLISFDVTSLFTNVPLDFTIDLILKRIYDRKEIKTSISREEMKELLLICTKNVHFTFNGTIYTQNDGVAMGSPLGPVIAGIFMVELERSVVPTLSRYMSNWKRYVDDTICWINEDAIEIVLKKLNSFHKNISFTYEMESDGNIAFLDVQLIRQNCDIVTTVFRKATDNDIYLSWNSFAPIKWKRGTLRTLILRAHNICSNEFYLKKELEHIRNAFRKINGYPNWIINQEMKKFEAESEQIDSAQQKLSETVEEIESVLMLPYQGEEGEKVLKSLSHTIKSLEIRHKLKIIYSGNKLRNCFQIKDKNEKKHEHNLVYEVTCPNETCSATYIGETARRLTERVKDHAGRDHNSHFFSHSLETGHKFVTIDDFTILMKDRNMGNYFKRKTSEALLIKSKKPILNKQQKSRPVKLFN